VGQDAPAGTEHAQPEAAAGSSGGADVGQADAAGSPGAAQGAAAGAARPGGVAGRHAAPPDARVPARPPATAPAVNSGGVADAGTGTATAEAGVLELGDEGAVAPAGTGGSGLVWIDGNRPEGAIGRHARRSGRHAHEHRRTVGIAGGTRAAGAAIVGSPGVPDGDAAGRGGNGIGSVQIDPAARLAAAGSIAAGRDATEGRLIEHRNGWVVSAGDAGVDGAGGLPLGGAAAGAVAGALAAGCIGARHRRRQPEGFRDELLPSAAPSTEAVAVRLSGIPGGSTVPGQRIGCAQGRLDVTDIDGEDGYGFGLGGSGSLLALVYGRAGDPERRLGSHESPGAGPRLEAGEQAAERDATERAAVERAAVEQGAVEPGAVEPGAVEPGAVEPGAVEPGAVEPGAAEQDVAPPAEESAVRPEAGAVECQGSRDAAEGQGDRGSAAVAGGPQGDGAGHPVRYRFGYDDDQEAAAGVRCQDSGGGWHDWRPAGSHQHWQTPRQNYTWRGAPASAAELPGAGADGAGQAPALAVGLMVAGGALRRFRRP
jgi:hypothetical protein